MTGPAKQHSRGHRGEQVEQWKQNKAVVLLLLLLLLLHASDVICVARQVRAAVLALLPSKRRSRG
jgi:hypothetical protein